MFRAILAGLLAGVSFIAGLAIGFAVLLALSTPARAAQSRIKVEVVLVGDKTQEANVLGAATRGDNLVLLLDACGTLINMTVPNDMVAAEDPEIEQVGQALLEKYCGG